MTDYRFADVLVWDIGPGGAVKILRGGTVTVKNADTDAVVMTATSDQRGRVTFTTTDVPTIYYVSPSGLTSELITSPDAFREAGAASADAAASAQSAQAASESIVGHSHILLDTDGVPYVDVASDGTQVVHIDVDGVPFLWPPSGPTGPTTSIVADPTSRLVTQDGLVGAGRNLITGWFHADGYGLATGNTAAANDAALAAAVADMASGDTLYIPAGRYQFTTFTPGNAIRILGGGLARVSSPLEWGDSRWTTDGAEVSGTVLQSVASSGVAIALATSASVSGTVLENLVVAGPGSGAATGLQLGGAGGIGYPVRVRLNNVVVGNFPTGVIASCENSTLHGLTVMACGAGFSGVYPFNGNTVTGIDVERCTGTALALNGCDTNVFAGGVVQGNKADGVVLSGGCYGNMFTATYFENLGTGAYDDIRITDGRSNEFHRIHLGSTSGTPRVTLGSGAIANEIRASRGYAGGSIANAVVLSGSRSNRVLGVFGGAVTDDVGSGNVVERTRDSGAAYVPPGYVGSALSVDVAPEHHSAVMTGGGQAFHLPDPTTVTPWRVYRVKNAGAATNNTVDSRGTSKTIDGAASVTLVAWQSRSFVSDGTQWLTI